MSNDVRALVGILGLLFLTKAGFTLLNVFSKGCDQFEYEVQRYIDKRNTPVEDIA